MSPNELHCNTCTEGDQQAGKSLENSTIAYSCVYLATVHVTPPGVHWSLKYLLKMIFCHPDEVNTPQSIILARSRPLFVCTWQPCLDTEALFCPDERRQGSLPG